MQKNTYGEHHLLNGIFKIQSPWKCQQSVEQLKKLCCGSIPQNSFLFTFNATFSSWEGKAQPLNGFGGSGPPHLCWLWGLWATPFFFWLCFFAPSLAEG